MDLSDLLTFHWNNLEAGEENGGKHTHLKVGEQIARAIATTRDTKRTKFQRALTVGSIGTETIGIPPARIKDTTTEVKGHKVLSQNKS